LKQNNPSDTLTGREQKGFELKFRGLTKPGSGTSKIFEALLRSSLQETGEPHRDVNEILATTPDPTPYSYKHEYLESGTKLYAFANLEQTGEYGRKSGKSPYYCMAEDIEQLEREGLLDVKNKTIDRMAIKDRLALPCTNRLECLVEAEVTHSHGAVRTMIGEAEETFIFDEETSRTRQMQGGGWQIHPNVENISLHRSPEQKHAQIATWPPDSRQKAIFRDFNRFERGGPDDGGGGGGGALTDSRHKKTETQQPKQETMMPDDNKNFSSLKVPSLREVLQKRQKDDEDLSKLKLPPVPTKESNEKATSQQDSSALSPGTPSRESLSERVERKKREQEQPEQSFNSQQLSDMRRREEERAKEKRSKKEKGQAREKEPSINQERSIDRGFER
jgi:hypothetical protein